MVHRERALNLQATLIGHLVVFMRAATTLLCVLTLGAISVDAALARPLERQGQVAAPPATQPDPRFEQLTNLRLREQAEQNPELRLKILNDIVQLSIQMGAPDEAARARRDQLDKEIKATQAKVEREQGLRKRLADLKQSAQAKLQASPADLAGARLDITEAQAIDKNDAEIAALDAQWQSLRQNALFGRIATVVIATIAVVVAMLPFLKKGSKAVKVRELEMLEGPEPGDIYKLEKDCTSLGAVAPDADVVITDPFRKISRRHCEIERNGSHYFLTDRSTNGTRINNKPVPKGEPVLLKKGDLIAIADDVVLRFQ